jgi:hypothetical protein
VIRTTVNGDIQIIGGFQGVDFEKNARVDEAFLLTVVTGRIGRCTEEH